MKAFRRTMWIHYIRRILYIRWIAAVAILAAVVLGGTTACTLAGLRMGPRLQVTPPSINVWQAATPTPMPPAGPVAEPAQARGMCGQQGSVMVLLLGESLPEDRPLRGASGIRLVKVDYDAGTVRVLALPPYLQVRTPALAAAGIESTVLTQVYWEALTLGTGSERARMGYATNVFAQALADNFGLVPDTYVTVKQGTFVGMVDALGGLEIDLPEDVDGSPSGFPHFRPGPQVLDGQATLDYFSVYPAAGDAQPIEWERLVRQRQVIAALRTQLIRPQTAARLPALIRRFYYDVVTDLGLSQALSLACVLQAQEASIEYLALAPDMVTEGPEKVLTPKMEPIMAFLETSFTQ